MLSFTVEANSTVDNSRYSNNLSSIIMLHPKFQTRFRRTKPFSVTAQQGPKSQKLLLYGRYAINYRGVYVGKYIWKLYPGNYWSKFCDFGPSDYLFKYSCP